MAQISTICTTPEIQVRPACGGVVTLLATGAGRGATYAWNLGNSTIATGAGPINAVYTGTGPYTVTLTTTYPNGCQTTTTESVTPDQGNGCCPSGIAVANLLGAVGSTTTLSGGRTFSGNYRVLGDLILVNGTYALNNATFYVEGSASKTRSGGGYQRTVSGSTITVGTNATLTLDQSTLTASGSSTTCPMWRGVVVNSNGQGPSGTYRVVIQHNSIISHALCAISMEDNTQAGTTAYLLDHSTFSNNLTHVLDNSTHTGSQPSLITNCTFDSYPAQMHFPYEQTAAGDIYYTYQALVITPGGSYPGIMHAVEVRNNNFYQAVYGIVNNLFDRAGVLIQNNSLNKVFQTGIWTVNNDTNGGTALPVTSGNTIAINAYPVQNTDQIDPTATTYGIVGEDTRIHNAFVGNMVTGDNNSSNTKPLVGMSITLQTDASGNTLDYFDEGIRTIELDGSSIFDSQMGECKDGFVVQPSPNGMYQIDRLGCNSFVRPLSSGNSRGIVVQNDAFINDIGDPGNPAANQFDSGLGAGVYNDGVPFQYFQTNSSQEKVTRGGNGTINLQTIVLPASSLANYCANQGATKGNGVNQARTTAPSAGYIAALMDSVRQQLVPPARSRSYLYEVVSYHASAQQLPALETWWATLALPNATAYRTVGRYLLRTYDQKPATAAAAQRVQVGLQVAALLNPELAAQLKLRTALQHLSQTMPRLVAADSVLLRTLAWSGTSVAAPAGRWLRYFYPRIPLPTSTPAPAQRLTTKRKLALTESGAVLGAPYPNPAQTEVIISCKLAQAGQAAELRFMNLLTGQVQLVVPVEGTGTERSQKAYCTACRPGSMPIS